MGHAMPLYLGYREVSLWVAGRTLWQDGENIIREVGLGGGVGSEGRGW